VALIQSRANCVVASNANSVVAKVSLRASIIVIARGVVWLWSNVARSSGWVARTSIVTLVSVADNRVGSNTDTSLAFVVLGALVVVITSLSIWNWRVGAKSSRVVANTSIVALVLGLANNRNTNTDTSLAGVV